MSHRACRSRQTIERDASLQTTALEIENDEIVGIYVMRNPDKLRHLDDRLAP